MTDRLMHAGRMIYALANHFDWFRNRMMTEWSIDGGVADLVFVSKAGYVTEIEIKVSRSDWKKDSEKLKWRLPRPHIARFFYAVPAALLARVPNDLMPEAGILSVDGDGEYDDHVRLVRAAKRLKDAKPMSVAAQLHMLERCYIRFWSHEMRRWRNQIVREKQRAQSTELAA